ncbi:MAG: ATP-grasp domain-containing protein [Betaproteobacteria bacterium]|nr:MAG: ATP-grasp domain-containing protein [Betaproteobacteria bacterium]
MQITLLHSADALEPPVDPVLDQLTRAIEVGGHAVRRISVADDIMPIATELKRERPDLVFNLTESFAGVSSLDSNLAALLNLFGLRYTGSSPAGLLLAGDKSLAKKVLGFHGIRTPEFATLYRGAVDWAGDIAFPVIVKPPQEDASIGITSGAVVHDIKDLLGRIDSLQSEFHSPVLVEEFVDGREFYVGVLGNLHAQPLAVMELDFSGLPAGAPRIASWEAKWGADGTGTESEAEHSAEFAGTKAIFPTDLDEELVERMQRIAVETFEALRLRDYARIDLRTSASGEVFVIEVNPNCYLERNAEFARAADKDGIGYDALVARIIELAMARYAR